MNQLKRLAAFQNPEFYKKQALRLSTALTPRVISCAEDLPDHIGLPRGCRDELLSLLSEHGVTLDVEDRANAGKPLTVKFHGKLSAVQKIVADQVLAHDSGVLVAPPGAGKTVVGIHLIAARARNTLVLVHRAQLLEQWRAQIALFLRVEPKSIGQIGAGKRKMTHEIDVAMIQSLARRDGADDLVAEYGHVIVDECHHVPAVSFERAMREVRARYVTGLTATPVRRDGHEPIIELQLGPVRASIDSRRDAARRPFEHRVVVRETTFRLSEDGGNQRIQTIYQSLARDQVRNDLIVEDVAQSLKDGRCPLVLTERRDAGRLHRVHDDKTDVRICDYVDREVPMLARMFEKRVKGYRAMGYEVISTPDPQDGRIGV